MIIPFASIEQHGPHLPVDVDLRLAREVCLRAARRNPDCLVMTPMAFGFEPHHMAWPGTIDVDWDVLIRYGVCVVSSLARHGFRRILIINGHGSNRPILEMIVRLAQVRHPEILVAGQSWFALGKVAEAFQPLQESNHTSHACELETAAYLAIDPDAVDMSQAVADYSFRRSPHFWADLTGKKPDADSTVPLIAMEYFATGSFTGVRGDPSKATAAKGEAALEAAADEVAAIVDEMRAREIIPPPDHHEADVEALKRQARPPAPARLDGSSRRRRWTTRGADSAARTSSGTTIAVSASGRPGAARPQTRVCAPSTISASARKKRCSRSKERLPKRATRVERVKQVADPGRGAEGRAGLDQRHAAEVRVRAHQLLEPEAAGLEQAVHAAVHPVEVVRVVDDGRGVAMRPLDPDLHAAVEHRAQAPNLGGRLARKACSPALASSLVWASAAAMLSANRPSAAAMSSIRAIAWIVR